MNAPKGFSTASGTGRAAGLGLIALAILSAGFQSSCTVDQPATRPIQNAVRSSTLQEPRSPHMVDRTSNPVIFVHGTMGSQMVNQQTGRIVWGDFGGGAANDYEPEAIRGLALPMKPGHSLASLHDGVIPRSIMNHVGLTVVPGLHMHFDYYGNALERFGNALNGGASPEAALDQLISCDRCLEFSYDWRRSTDENAARLARFIEEKKAVFVRRHGYPKTMKFDLIGHSLGNLVIRYYLRYGDQPLPHDGSAPSLTWAGAPRVGNVAMLGAPNSGIPLILQHLTHGHRVKPLFPKYEAAVVGTMPSTYQVLPRARDAALLDPDTGEALDPLDYQLWVRKEWGLANPGQDNTLKILLPHVRSAARRRAIALDHLRKCLRKAAQLQAALDRPARKPRHLRIAIYAGQSEKTAISFHAIPRQPKLHRHGKGDGVVPLASALHCPSPNPANRDLSICLSGWDETHLFNCDHTGVACKKTINQRVIGRLGSAR